MIGLSFGGWQLDSGDAFRVLYDGKVAAERVVVEPPPVEDWTAARVTVAVSSDGRQLTRTLGTPSWRFEVIWKVTGRTLTQVSRLRRLAGDAKVYLPGFRLQIEGMNHDPEDRLTAPGPFWEWTYLRPSGAIRDLEGMDRDLHGTPDGSFGLVVLEAGGRAIGVWPEPQGDLGGFAAVVPHINVQHGRLTMTYSDERARFMARGDQATSARFRWAVRPDRRGIFAEVRAGTRRDMPIARPTPEWVRNAVILEAYPKAYGSFQGLTQRLPFYRSVGFNVLYLMPHWPGGYMPIDLLGVDPQYGSEKDLKELVTEAHRLGMRVLFDLVIHGTSPENAWVRTRPELYVHRADGTLDQHRTWRSVSTDWASPAYRRAMAEVAKDHVRRFDIDGYRVDAAGFKQPSPDPASPFPAYLSGSNSPAVVQGMLEELRKVKPDAQTLAEVFGPVFYGNSNFVHDNQTEALEAWMRMRAAGKVDAEDYRRHLADVAALLDPDATRVVFTRNHDTSWFARFDGYTPCFFALEAIHALCAIPEAFGGDPDYPHHPDDDPTVWERYRRLFSAKAMLKGRTDYEGALQPNRKVFTATRGRTVIAVSLSDDPEVVRLSREGRWRVDDPLSGASLGRVSGETELVLTLPPFGARILRPSR